MLRSEASSSPFASLEELRPHDMRSGRVSCRVIQGKDVMLAICEVAPNVEIPEQRHVNEQIGFVILGTITYVVEGVEKLLKPGDTYAIPSNAAHSASTGMSGATVVDIFAPPRDWDHIARLKPSKPAWP